MPGLSLRAAATETGTSKSTILRAIQAGRLSATRTDDGGYSIDPAELFRVYPPKGSTDAPQQPADQSVGQDAPFDATAQQVELRIRNAQLESEVKALQAILESEKKRAEELRAERDRWATQAERLALPAPVPVTTPEPQGRGWWLFRRRA